MKKFNIKDFDFGGWATKFDIVCEDGRVIKHNAFTANDGQKVPLVWHHIHNDPGVVLGHGFLENRSEGVYIYGKFNDTEKACHIKQCVVNGDIDKLSIFANQLKHNGRDVVKGNIREVSLVLSGANSGAYIDSVLAHGEFSDEEGIIFPDIELDYISHGGVEMNEDPNQEPEVQEEGDNPEQPEVIQHSAQEVYDSLNEEQLDLVSALLHAAHNDNNEKGDEIMKTNAFDSQAKLNDNTQLAHAAKEAQTKILANAKKFGSLKDCIIDFLENDDTLAHATDESGNTVTYGIADIDWLFPEAKNITETPMFIARKMGWVSKVMSGVKKQPFSRIKTMFADITEDEARAKGYMKGKLKKEEVFTLLKRSTTPTTIYKKQKLDRDDVIDITDFNVVAWIKAEMRLMLDEEIARAILVGDGRSTSSDDKINELNIRPIYKEAALFCIHYVLPGVTAGNTEDEVAKAFVRGCVKSRIDYRGSGNPTLFTTEEHLTNCLLLEDVNGRVIYDTIEKLATAMRVSEIVTVPVMEGLVRTGETGAADAGKKFDLLGLIVNLTDYSCGADKGGAIGMFEDFDIDYNQQKYLIETRCSGALTVPKSAIVIELEQAKAASGGAQG